MPAYTLREDRERAIQTLAQEFPKTFFVIGERRKPLKLNIEKDIEAEVAKDNDHPLLDYDIADALAWYQSHVGYQKACSIAGTSRLDLQGKPVSKITAAEACEAEEEAKEGFAKMAERRKQRAAANGLPPQLVAPPAPKAKALPVNGALSSIEMLTEIEKQLELAKMILGDSPDDPLRKELARPALRLMADELSTIIARLDSATS
jgi:sRNA-binding protein